MENDRISRGLGSSTEAYNEEPPCDDCGSYFCHCEQDAAAAEEDYLDHIYDQMTEKQCELADIGDDLEQALLVKNMEKLKELVEKYEKVAAEYEQYRVILKSAKPPKLPGAKYIEEAKEKLADPG